MELQNSISRIKGMGPKTEAIFLDHGIRTIEDLLNFYPRAWINASKVVAIKDLRLGSSGLIDIEVVTTKEGYSQRTRKPYLRATVADTSGSLETMWFNQPYLKQKIKPGARFKLYGRLQGWRAQDAVMMAPKFITEPSIIPVYPAIGGLPSFRIHALMKELRSCVTLLDDYLPESVRMAHDLVSLSQAIGALHFPESISDINRARLRLGFDEVLMLMVPALLAKKGRDGEQTEVLRAPISVLDNWMQQLPFALTSDQKQVIAEILEDMQSSKPMNRLVQGDVGSGKTVVGLAAVLQAVQAGKQAAWLAPTELLARQHFATAQQLLRNTAASVGLWTRTNHAIATPEGESKASIHQVTDQSLIIGTHALLSEKVQFKNLGLLIIDEQHRFGVEQRAKLRTFGGKPIHLLSMTATPIPRTMALLLYGDLQLSTIKEKPSGRKDVATRVVEEKHRQQAYRFIDAHIRDGGQVYVVCPLIEPAHDDEANLFSQLFEAVEEKKAVTTWFESLKKEFPTQRLGMLHGKLKAKEKEAVMAAFRQGEIDMLVSTTVIEVGVDVPNANIMVIEGAERFGLAQLHQLRGRVGRGERQSFCLLFPSDDDFAQNERLKILEQTTDGFLLAEKDLELRGPGEMTGLAQSGIPPLRFASLQDTERIHAIRNIAEELIAHPTFKQSLERFWRTHHPE